MKIKELVKKINKKKAVLTVTMVALNLVIFAMPVFAGETQQQSGATYVSNSLKSLFDIISAFVSSFGGIQVLWGVFEWGNATNTQDGMMQSMAIRRIGGGLIETIAGQIVNALLGIPAK